MMPENKPFYISLVRGLVGYYVKVIAIDVEVVRQHCVEYYGRLWCSVYTEDEMNRIKENYDVNVINEDKPIVLNEHWEYE